MSRFKLETALASYLLGRPYWVWSPHGLYKLLLREPHVCRMDVSALLEFDAAQLAAEDDFGFTGEGPVGISTARGDLADAVGKAWPQLAWQIVAHALDDVERGTGDAHCQVATGLHRNQHIGGTVDDVRRNSRHQPLGQEPFVLGPDDRVALASRLLQTHAIKDRDVPPGVLNKSGFLQFERC